jgi:hypothetical protein
MDYEFTKFPRYCEFNFDFERNSGVDLKFKFKTDNDKFCNTFKSKKDKKKPKKFLSADQYSSIVPITGTIFPNEKLPLDLYISLQFTKRSITDYVDLINSHVTVFRTIKQLKYYKNNGIQYIYNSILQKQEYLRYIMKYTMALRRFVQIWLYKKYKVRELNTEDPATLSKPEKPIFIYDTKAKGVFMFEASTIKNQFISDLGYSDWLLPYVRHPKNPFTNLPFSIGQKIKIINDLKSYDISSWFIEGYKTSKYDLNKFQEEFTIPIRLKSLNDLIKNNSSEQFIVLLSEFVEDQYYHHKCNCKSYLNIIYWSINKHPNDAYIKMWTNTFYKFYRMEIIYGKDHLENNDELYESYYTETKNLLNDSKEIKRLNHLRLQSISIII